MNSSPSTNNNANETVFVPDPAFMRRAIDLAERARGYTAPNPCVGAVAVHDGRIVAEGWHTACGKPHAEVECIADARVKGADLTQCDLYVTLEPCNHHGKTPPCTKAILQAGIPRVIVGSPDPNKDVAGGGMSFLRDNGVEVFEDVERQACDDLIADFLVWKETERPYIYLKLASTLDGKIATRSGHSRWVTGAESRAQVHELRSRVRAVLVGGKTFFEDDPELDVRFGCADRCVQPLAVVLTSRLPEPDSSMKLIERRADETLFLTAKQTAESDTAVALRKAGCRVWGLSGAPGDLDISEGLRRLRNELDCWSVLCEGGGGLGMSLMASGLVDELQLFMAPKILGDAQARNLFSGRTIERMDHAIGFSLRRMDRFGEDVRMVLRPKD